MTIEELEAVLRMMGKGDTVDRLKNTCSHQEQYRTYLETILKVRLMKNDDRRT